MFRQAGASPAGVEKNPSAGPAGRSRRRRAGWLWLLGVPVLAAGSLVVVGLPAVVEPQRAGAALRLLEGYQPLDIPYAELPYHDQPDVPVIDAGLHDGRGVRMFQWLGKGKLLDHPVAQAQWGLSNLNTYRRTGKRMFLERAVAQAQRNLDRRVESRGGWWYPYEFDLTRCASTPVIDAPWYSAMAQGQLLGLFVRLFEATKDEKWRVAADRTFATLVLAPRDDVPWGTWTDPDGQVWLEEYPRSQGIAGERVLNGHVFAMYGVYDYWRLTDDPRAGALFGTAAATVRHHVPRHFRNPQWASRYSVDCNGPHLKYHQIHIGQMLMLYRMTGDSVFVSYASQLRADYPAPKVAGKVGFTAGLHVGYRFSDDGDIVAQTKAAMPADATATTDQRIRIQGRGIHYRITSGGLAGWYVTETIGQRVLLGSTARHDYHPPLTLTIGPGSYTGYAFDPKGEIRKTIRVTFERGTSAEVTSTAWLNGEFGYRLSTGPLAGHWLPHRTGLTLS